MLSGGCEPPDGSRTDALKLLDRLRHGHAVDRAAGEALAGELLAVAGELVRVAGGVLTAPDAEFHARLLSLLELVLGPTAAGRAHAERVS